MVHIQTVPLDSSRKVISTMDKDYFVDKIMPLKFNIYINLMSNASAF